MGCGYRGAVSRHVRALEDSLGLRLFERVGWRAVLTSAWRVLRARLETLLREADTLPQVLKDLSEGVQGASESARASPLLTRSCRLFWGSIAKNTRGSDWLCSRAAARRVIENLRRGEIDVAFVASDRLPSDATTLAEIPDELVLIAAPNHKTSLRRGLKPGDLSGCDFIQREPTSDTRALVAHWFEAEGIQVQNLMDVW